MNYCYGQVRSHHNSASRTPIRIPIPTQAFSWGLYYLGKSQAISEDDVTLATIRSSPRRNNWDDKDFFELFQSVHGHMDMETSPIWWYATTIPSTSMFPYCLTTIRERLSATYLSWFQRNVADTEIPWKTVWTLPVAWNPTGQGATDISDPAYSERRTLTGLGSITGIVIHNPPKVQGGKSFKNWVAN